MTNTTNTAAPSWAADTRDILERLRDTPNWRKESYGHWKDCVTSYDRAPFDAANEIERLRAALAAPAQPLASDHLFEFWWAEYMPEVNQARAWEAWRATPKAEPAAPAQAGEYPADTGTPEADRIIGRLTSSDPDFDDCTDAAALIRKMVAEHKGPDGFATWKDAAVAERVRRVEVGPMPLPRHRYCLNSSPVMPGYTADEMIAYRAARGAARAAPVDAADSDRLDWLTFKLNGAALRAIGVVWSEYGDARRAIDAARAAQEGK